jgi:hypothetical protein
MRKEQGRVDLPPSSVPFPRLAAEVEDRPAGPIVHGGFDITMLCRAMQPGETIIASSVPRIVNWLPIERLASISP